MRLRTLTIYAILSNLFNFSFRQIARLTGIPKSSAHRHAQIIQKRDLYPESHLWETKEGLEWLRLLYFGAILFFGVQCGIGAEKLSAFFKLLRLDKHIGISPSTIKKYCAIACELLAKYQQEQENQHQFDEPMKIVGGIDETYFKTMILVLMDLSSGYIFVEEESEDKCYETWFEKAKRVADKFGIKFKFFVSDRAKQLIKLATQGFQCPSIPDLFHASHELVKLFGLNLNRKKAEIQKKLVKEVAKLSLLIELHKDVHIQVSIIMELKAQEGIIDRGISTYHEILKKLSKTLHPFDIANSSKMTSAMIALLIYQLLREAEELKETHDISSKKNHLKKFGNQIDEMASLIDTWWLWVGEYLQENAINDDCKSWLTQYLLPLLYWQKQAARTKNPDLKEAYQNAADEAQIKLDDHPLTQDLIKNEEMISWAKWMVTNFQRTSSAVEGRNGWLSQMHHNGRGLSPKRLKALTVLHNYYLKRDDGTTAAERLFRKKIPDPLEWVINRMGELPLPREANKHAI